MCPHFKHAIAVIAWGVPNISFKSVVPEENATPPTLVSCPYSRVVDPHFRQCVWSVVVILSSSPEESPNGDDYQPLGPFAEMMCGYVKRVPTRDLPSARF